MIKELRKKFICISMMSIASIVLLITVLMNIIVKINFDKEADRSLSLLANSDGDISKLINFKGSEIDLPLEDSSVEINPEYKYIIRYFMVTYTENKDPISDLSHISIDESTALNLADKAISSQKKSGYLKNFKYLIVKDDLKTKLFFLDCFESIKIQNVILIISLLIGLVIIIFMFILTYIFSNKAIKPFVDNVYRQKQFITDASHEIKTPLAIISANTDILELTSGKNEWIESIQKQIVNLNNLVKDLITLSRMEEKIMGVDLDNLPLSDIMNNSLSEFSTVAKNNNKVLVPNIQENITIKGNSYDIKMLISILIDNAIKYANDNSEIKVNLSSYKKKAIITISNKCDDMDKSETKKIFSRFYRTDNSRVKETSGHGIGLSIATAIVTRHKGTISADFINDNTICFKVII